MSLSSVEKEMQCTIHWFKLWNPPQKDLFLNDLVTKAVPENLCALFTGLESMSIRAETPDIFHHQLRLFSQWFLSWTDKERNAFLMRLEVIDPGFIERFSQCVASTAGQL